MVKLSVGLKVFKSLHMSLNLGKLIGYTILGSFSNMRGHAMPNENLTPTSLCVAALRDVRGCGRHEISVVSRRLELQVMVDQ